MAEIIGKFEDMNMIEPPDATERVSLKDLEIENSKEAPAAVSDAVSTGIRTPEGGDDVNESVSGNLASIRKGRTVERSKIVPIEKAKEIAKDLPGLADAVLRAEEANWDVIELVAMELEGGQYDIVAREPNGVMVALMIPDWLGRRIAIPGGEDAGDLHITLAYLGDASAMSLDDQRKLIGVVGEVALRHQYLEGALQGTGTFPPNEGQYPLWVGVDIPGLLSMRDDLVRTLKGAGFEFPNEFPTYNPHVTVAYLPEGQERPAMEFKRMEMGFDHLTVAIGGSRYKLHMQDDHLMSDMDAEGWVPQAFTKAVEVKEEQRYTLGPVYIPGELDAHNEHTDADTLQKSIWDYVRKGDRGVRLQHNTDVVAGECVEVLSWPFEVEVPMQKADGTMSSYKYPAGTPFMGTVWEPAAWELIKQGKLTGYSIGGKADMIEVDLGEGDVEAFDA